MTQMGKHLPAMEETLVHDFLGLVFWLQSVESQESSAAEHRPPAPTHTGKFQCGNVMLILEESEWKQASHKMLKCPLCSIFLAIPSYNKLCKLSIVLVSCHLGESVQGPRTKYCPEKDERASWEDKRESIEAHGVDPVLPAA